MAKKNLGAKLALYPTPVTVVGAISYIGLVVPNIVSLFKGDDLRGTLPDTALSGELCAPLRPDCPQGHCAL